MPLTGQQHYHSHLLRSKDRNRDRGLDDPLGNAGNPDRSSGCGISSGTPSGGDGGPPEDPYEDGSDSSFSSEFGRLHMHE